MKGSLHEETIPCSSCFSCGAFQRCPCPHRSSGCGENLFRAQKHPPRAERRPPHSRHRRRPARGDHRLFRGPLGQAARGARALCRTPREGIQGSPGRRSRVRGAGGLAHHDRAAHRGGCDAKNVDEKGGTDLLARAWTLLNTTYDEVSAAVAGGKNTPQPCAASPRAYPIIAGKSLWIS